MALVRILYGDELREFSVPDERLMGIYQVTPPPSRDIDELLEEALDNPIGRELESYKSKKTLIVVNDATRLTPTPKMLEHILSRLKGDVDIIVATGTHRAPTEEEYRETILGHLYDDLRSRTTHHDCRASSLVSLGRTSRGTNIEVNRMLFDYDLVITLGSVEPHYFAGFTGGRKSIAPGLCSYTCAEQNHKLVLSPESALGKLRRNPVHEDLEEIVKIVAKRVNIFSLNVAITGKGEVWAARAGDIFESFYSLVEEIERYYRVRMPSRADIVVAVAPGEMGIDLYQSHKALEAAKLAVRKGGIAILIAPCWDGIGPRNFYDLLAGKSRDQIEKIIYERYKLGYHKVAKIIELLDMVDVYAVTELEPIILQRIGFKPFNSIQGAIDEALNRKDGKVAVLPEASITIPSPLGDS